MNDAGDKSRRSLILKTAAMLFRQHGYERTSVRQIAEALGMTSGSIFYHFTTKEELLVTVMEEGVRDILSGVQDGLAGESRLPERMLAMVRCHLTALLGPKLDAMTVMLYEWRSLTPAQRTAIARLKAQYEAPWVPVLQALHDAGWLRTEPPLARLFILGALNWAVQWYQPGGRLSLDALAQQALALFLGPPAGGPASLSSLETRA